MLPNVLAHFFRHIDMQVAWDNGSPARSTSLGLPAVGNLTLSNASGSNASEQAMSLSASVQSKVGVLQAYVAITIVSIRLKCLGV